MHEGEAAPDKCPNCGAPEERFAEAEDDLDLIHMNQGQKISYGQAVEVNPFFGSYDSLAPFIYNLPAGQKVGLHKHPTTDELFYVIRGKIKFTVGDREMVAAPGDLIQGPMDVPHCFENIGGEPAAFLSVKGPKPVDLVRL